MMDATSIANLLSYSAQVVCVVAIGALVPLLVRLDATIQYNYWRLLALLCVALPWLQPRIVRPSGGGDDVALRGTGEGVGSSAIEMSGALAIPSGIDWWTIAGVGLVTGIAARLVWIGIGLVRLHRLRRAGTPAETCGEHDELQQTIGARAAIRYIDDLPQPITFGVLRPVILLPSTLRGRPEHIRRAVLAHELLHVERRDWAWVLVEELVRAAFWSNPAVWWLVSRIQLAREEVVDELAVLVTGHRRSYVEALLAFADETPLAPAAAFARRRHLFRRMMLISREAGMSSKQIVASCALMLVMAAGGSWYAVRAFPLIDSFDPASRQTIRQTPGPLERKAEPVTPENPVPRRVSVTAPEYPAEARAYDATGTVTLRITLDELGRVAETRVAGVSVRSGAGQLSFASTSPEDLDRLLMHDPSTTDLRRVVDAFISSAIAAVEQWRYDPPYQAPLSFSVTINFSLGSKDGEAGMPPPHPPPPPPAHTGQSIGWTADGAVRIGSAVKPPKKIRHVYPVYPPIALAARVQGVVIVEARIGPDGRVENARVLRSIPLLDEAALDAVRQWEFTPTLMNGQPVAVVMTTTVNFTLADP